jgi:catechol 2,3-dioxygenase-like lactoylglutathione lyase family enzyme
MELLHIDHLVMTVRDIELSCAFYRRVLAMEVVEFAGGRKALSFGSQKINLHEQAREFEPRANASAPGSLDLCLLTKDSMEAVCRHLQEQNVEIIKGPIQRTGATGFIMSVYFRDPDGNLLELAHPLRSREEGPNHNPEPTI